jgi:hypothetical protein
VTLAARPRRRGTGRGQHQDRREADNRNRGAACAPNAPNVAAPGAAGRPAPPGSAPALTASFHG